MRRRVEIALSLYSGLFPFAPCRRKTLIKYKTRVPTAVVFGSFVFLILFLTTWIERRPVLGYMPAAVAAHFSRPTRRVTKQQPSFDRSRNARDQCVLPTVVHIRPIS